MIRITIEITDTPLSDERFYGKMEATPENVEPVSNHECQMRDMIMDTLQTMAKKFVESEGITRSIIAKVPIKKGGENDIIDRSGRDQGTVR